jgi:hypothetical protein
MELPVGWWYLLAVLANSEWQTVFLPADHPHEFTASRDQELVA